MSVDEYLIKQDSCFPETINSVEKIEIPTAKYSDNYYKIELNNKTHLIVVGYVAVYVDSFDSGRGMMNDANIKENIKKYLSDVIK